MKKALADAGMEKLAEDIFEKVGLGTVLQNKKTKVKVFDRLYQDALERIKAQQGSILKLTQNVQAQAVLSTLMTINNGSSSQLSRTDLGDMVSMEASENLLNFDIRD